MLAETTTDNSSSENFKHTKKMTDTIPKIKNLVNSALKQLRNQHNFSSMRKESAYTKTSETTERISIDLNIERTQDMIKSLQKGYVMVKHSPNTSPHDKFVYLSDDKRYICWKSLDKDDEKKIQLRKIELILCGQEQTIGYVKSTSIHTLTKLIIIKSSVRNLELDALNIEQARKFQLELEQVAKNAKSVHLSYQF